MNRSTAARWVIRSDEVGIVEADVGRTAADVDYLIYEYDRAPNPLESLHNGADYLQTWNGPNDRNQN